MSGRDDTAAPETTTNTDMHTRGEIPMTRSSTALVRALGAALVLAPALGWTVFEAAVKERSFQGDIEVWIDRQLPNGKTKIVDSFVGRGLSFKATVAEVAGGKQVTSKWVLNGKTEKGKPFTVQLVGPAKMDADLKSGSVMLDLPIRWTVNGRTVEKIVELSTDVFIPSPKGALTGQRMKIQNGSSPIRLVGQTTTGAAEVASSEQEILELSDAKQQDLVELESQGSSSARKPRLNAAKPGPKATPLRLMLIVNGVVRAEALDR